MIQPSLFDELKSFLTQRDAPLIDVRELDDKTTEFIFEPQTSEDGTCLVRIYRLPAPNDEN